MLEGPPPGVLNALSRQSTMPSDGHRRASPRVQIAPLLTAATVARQHLHQQIPSGWPSFLLVGPTKGLKSVLGLAKSSGSTPPATSAASQGKPKSRCGDTANSSEAAAGPSTQPGYSAGHSSSAMS